LSEACTALRSAIDELESQLKAANEDAERLAEELELEQNAGYSCEALRLHRARLAGKEGE
jgi:glycerol-3-phosphate O-acyltransferase